MFDVSHSRHSFWLLHLRQPVEHCCISGMFLSGNICVTNTNITNCISYSGSSNAATCTQCSGAFYLQNNVCVARSVSSNIPNCQSTSLTADTCTTCSLGFILTSDSRACITSIPNCATFSSSTFQSTSLQCAVCNNGFYLTSSGSITVCVSGTVSFCLTYQVSANTCAVCNNGYYLVGNVCTAHATITNCQTYDQVKANSCAVCGSGYYTFSFTTVCVQTVLKANCVTYSLDGNSCATCASNYYVSGAVCQIIPTAFGNCATFSGTQCTLCNSGYMINTLAPAGTCVLPLDYIIASINSPCSVQQNISTGVIPTWIGVNTSTQAPLTCGTCSNYMYGYFPRASEAICVNSYPVCKTN